MWEYLAGLFDGDGCICIQRCLKGRSYSICFHLKITGVRTEGFKPIIEFLNTENIYSNQYTANKIKKLDEMRKHQSFNLVISSNGGIRKFIENIMPYTLFKKEQCKIVLEGLTLKSTIKKQKGKLIKDNIMLFDTFRHQLHALSVKGPRTLIPWN